MARIRPVRLAFSQNRVPPLILLHKEGIPMNIRHLPTVFCWASSLLVLASCSSSEKEPPKAASPVVERSVTTRPGVAGGLTEDVVVIEAIIVSVDKPNHRVTLKGPEGKEYSFDVNPRIKDLSELNVNDKVKATFSRRVFVDVKRADAPLSETYEANWGASGPGQMPGRLAAQETKKVGRVVAIDPATR